MHKESTPLRPVVATCGTSTYGLAQKLVKILRPLVGSSGRILRNTRNLVDSMENVKLEARERLVSYDVKSLFTSIPVDEAIEICERKLRDDEELVDRTGMGVDTIVQLLRFCLKSTAFQYKGTHYKQLDGVAMGSLVSPVIADIFMENLEDIALKTGGVEPRVWRRFVDDVIACRSRRIW